MKRPTTEDLFKQYRQHGDAEALGMVFDRVAPQLVLIAARLAGSSVAEDLVQATFLDAIHQRDRWDSARPLAPWLVGILSNHVREARRQRQRVPDPERLARRVDQPASFLAEANECVEAVHAAVERLPRHYRQVLSLRLVHGLEQQQISASLDVPLGTVKVRLHRGMQLLRRALPAGLATSLSVLATPGLGLAAVRQVVLREGGVGVGVGVGAAGVATAGGVGILIGGAVMKQFVLGIVACILLGAVWFTVDSMQAQLPATPENGDSGQTPTTAEAVSNVDDGENRTQPVVLDEARNRVAAPTSGRLELDVVWDSDREPATHIEVSVLAVGVAGASATATTDDAGKAVFESLPPGSHRLRIRRTQIVDDEPFSIEAGENQLRQVALLGDMRLRITVADTFDVPRADATVWASDPYRSDDVNFQLGQCNASGVFLYRGLPLHAVWARAAGAQPSPSYKLEKGKQTDATTETVAVRLALGPPGCTLQGVVLDPDGQPAAGAKVTIACDDSSRSKERREELTLLANAVGRFACNELPAGARAVVADADGFAPAIERATTAADQPATVTLALRRGAALSGRVTDPEGNPLEGIGIYTSLRHRSPGLTSWMGAYRTARTDTNGHYHIAAIAPGETRIIAQVKPQTILKLVLADDQQETWNVQQGRNRHITGVVTNTDDEPLAAWQVVTNDNSGLMLERRVITDTAGRFRIDNLDDADYRLLVFEPMSAEQSSAEPVAAERSPRGAACMVPSAVVNRVRPSSNDVPIRIDAAAMATAWIEGSITMPEGLQATTTLTLYAKSLRGGAFAVPRKQLELGTTTFRMGPLPSGEYDLLCDIEGRGQMEQRGLHLLPDQTLRLPAFAATQQQPLHLVLRHTDGTPATGAVVALKPGMLRCKETAPGRYSSPPIAPGSVEAIVRGPDLAPCTYPLNVEAGAATFEHTVAAGTPVRILVTPATPRQRWVGAMRVRIVSGSGVQILRDLVQIEGGHEFLWAVGLIPGTYSIDISVAGDGQGQQTFDVGTAPIQIDLRLQQ